MAVCNWLTAVLSWPMIIWHWLKDTDAPNWFGIVFSLFAWPLILYWWSIRKIQSVPHLAVLPQRGSTDIGVPTDIETYDAVHFVFTNRTGRVVYLSRARLRECISQYHQTLAGIWLADGAN